MADSRAVGSAETVSVPPAEADPSAQQLPGDFGQQVAMPEEHPAVLGARLGACVFSALGFPAVLWVVGAVTWPVACGLAVALPLVFSRSIMSLGGRRVSRVLLVEIIIAAVLFTRVMPTWLALPLATLLPPLGMLVFSSLVASFAEALSAESQDSREAEVAVARATRSNVIDIRSGEAARRLGRTSESSGDDPSIAPPRQSQV